jgi:hypothetical protein
MGDAYRLLYCAYLTGFARDLIANEGEMYPFRRLRRLSRDRRERFEERASPSDDEAESALATYLYELGRFYDGYALTDWTREAIADPLISADPGAVARAPLGERGRQTLEDWAGLVQAYPFDATDKRLDWTEVYGWDRAMACP